jgi:hypothetical protein
MKSVAAWDGLEAESAHSCNGRCDSNSNAFDCGESHVTNVKYVVQSRIDVDRRMFLSRELTISGLCQPSRSCDRPLGP